MPLYTFYFDYQGGTYVSQVCAGTYKAAPKVWAEKLDLNGIVKNATPKTKQNLIEAVQLDTPVLLEGQINSWCISVRFDNNFGLVHYTQTAE